MNAPTLFKAYVWLLETIQSAGKISFQDLNDLWLRTEMSGGMRMPRSTFSRYKEAIESIYGIVIECDRHDNFKYYIENEDGLRNNSVVKWMHAMADLGNFVRDNMELKDRLFFDDLYREEAYFKIIVTAMKTGHKVRLSYIKSCELESDTLTMAPYFMKCFPIGWHLLGRFDSGEFGLIPVARISKLELSDQPFVFDASYSNDEFVSQCYSLISRDYTDEEILVRAKGDMRHCFVEKPLHLTQEIVEETPDHVDYSLKMRMSPSFIRCMLERNPDLEILSPQWLIDEMETLKRIGLRIYM